MPELHIPGYNYAGPGTNLTGRLSGALGDDKRKPVNTLDYLTLLHDILYTSTKPSIRYEADRILLKDIKAVEASLPKAAVKAVFETKGLMTGQPQNLTDDDKKFVAKAIDIWKGFSKDDTWKPSLERYIDLYKDISLKETGKLPDDFKETRTLLESNNPYDIDLPMSDETKVIPSGTGTRSVGESSSESGRETSTESSGEDVPRERKLRVDVPTLFTLPPEDFIRTIDSGKKLGSKKSMNQSLTALKRELYKPGQPESVVFKYTQVKGPGRTEKLKDRVKSAYLSVRMLENAGTPEDLYKTDITGAQLDRVIQDYGEAIGADANVWVRETEPIKGSALVPSTEEGEPPVKVEVARKPPPTVREIKEARRLVGVPEDKPLPFVPRELTTVVREEKVAITEKPIQVIGDLRPKFIIPSKEILQPSPQQVQTNQKLFLMFNYVMPGQAAPGTDTPQTNGLLAGNRIEENLRYNNSGYEVPTLVNKNSGNFVLGDFNEWLQDKTSIANNMKNIARLTFKKYEVMPKVMNPHADFQSPYNGFTNENVQDVDIEKSMLLGLQP